MDEIRAFDFACFAFLLSCCCLLIGALLLSFFQHMHAAMRYAVSVVGEACHAPYNVYLLLICYAARQKAMLFIMHYHYIQHEACAMPYATPTHYTPCLSACFVFSHENREQAVFTYHACLSFSSLRLCRWSFFHTTVSYHILYR